MPHPSFAHDVSEPSFSLDGKRIVFRRHDGASGCASSDIYAVDTDGQNLVQLTHAASISQELAKLNRRLTPRCDRSYRQPRYSPDGSLILLLAFETTAKRNPETGQYYRGSKALVAIMPADGGDLEILAEGEVYCRPYFWSADGESIYYAGCGEQDYRLTRMDLATRAAQVVGTQSLGGVLGRMPGREWVADHVGDGRIAWYNIESGQPVFVGAWSVPGVKFVGGKKFELHGFDWSRSGAVLLWYDDGRSERFEVVRFPAILPIPPPPHELPGAGLETRSLK